ncbi:MAG: hypothetical protein DHS80DRAFT_30011 [Piptocephalis tieghemiana]|nr:MAG: hypothetical protein DHS80DRAFT_30011 [Piptocephalis tieghemiana]
MNVKGSKCVSRDPLVLRINTPKSGGNYDVNVLEKALQQHQLTLTWIPAKQEDLRFAKGIILNVPSPYAKWLWGIVGGRHWLSLLPREEKQITEENVQEGGQERRVWWDLDSYCAQPRRIGNDLKLQNYLEKAVTQKDAQVFLIGFSGSPSIEERG